MLASSLLPLLFTISFPDFLLDADEVWHHQTWIPGIQDSREKEANCFQVKLKGRPWWSSSGDEIAHSRLLVCAILQAMDARGFELVGSIDMSVGQGEDNSDRKCSLPLPRLEAASMSSCVIPSSLDLRLIDRFFEIPIHLISSVRSGYMVLR